MIDLEKTKTEAEALAKLRKEQFYRETLAQELTIISDEHFKSKEPLCKVLPVFVGALKDLENTVKEIFDYLEGVEPKEAETEKTPAEVLEIINKKPIFSDRFVESAKKITEPKTADEVPSTAAAPEHHFHGPIPTTPKAAEPEAPKEEETTTKTRVSSKEIVSDETLELHYFKEGLSVPVIASMYKVGASGLYKRIEAMKAQRKQIEKECARQ